jgi:cobalt/nickel transport system permease protein
MGGGHRSRRALSLHIAGSSPVHRLPAPAKLVALVGFVVPVAVTPRQAVWAFAVHAGVLAAVIVVARLPRRVVLARLTVVAPFLIAAALLPFIGHGERTEVGGLSLSVDGSWAAWNMAAKAVLGAAAGIVVAATTAVPDLLAGLSRLRVPAILVAIIGFMIRYLDVIADELGRMRTAMVARGHDPRWLWQARPIASSVGTLFVRSYERGERVHLAMAARGFTGTMPDLGTAAIRRRDVAAAAVVVVVAVSTAAAALWSGAPR